MSSILCPNGVDIPELSSENCDGIYTSTNCIVQAGAITALGLPANSTQTQINTAVVLALAYKQELIDDLIARVEALETP